MPTDPRFQDLSRNEELLHYTAYWLAKREADWFEKLGNLLGTTWTREQVEKLVSTKKSAVIPGSVFLPLSLAVNPDLTDWLKQMFRVGQGQQIGGGEYVPGAGEEVQELGDLPKDEWMQWIGGATPVIRESVDQMNELASPVTINEGQAQDERIERIRNQIAHSKRW